MNRATARAAPIEAARTWNRWIDLVCSDDDLHPQTGRVLQALAHHIRAERCFPSVAELAGVTALSERTVAKHLRLAVKGRWLTAAEAHSVLRLR